MAGNSLLTSGVITKECLLELKNQMVFSKKVDRQYDDRFANKGGKIGDTINIRKPARYSVTTGATLEIQDSVDASVALVLDTQQHVGMAFSSKDLSLSIDEFKDRYIKPAMSALANKIDITGYSAMYKATPNFVGVPSATALPSTLKGFTQAYALIANRGGPLDNLSAIVDPNTQASLVEGLKSLFQSSSEIKKQYEKGQMGMAAGMEFSMSQNVSKHTAGAPDGTPAIKTTITSQGASTVAVDGLTTATIAGCYKEGDILTFGSVYAVNPITKVSTGELMQFVVTATTAAASNEIASLPISPAIYSTGAYQNVDSLPVDGAAIKLFGHASTYASTIVGQNLVFPKESFALGCADLELPGGVDMASRASEKESGLSIRMVRQYDINNDRIIARLDVLYGWKALYPEWACRVVGQPA